MEQQIKAALIALFDGITAANGDAITRQMTLLDDFLATGRGRLHPQLVHFLERRSYSKALMFLDGEKDIPAGVCGGRSGR